MPDITMCFGARDYYICPYYKTCYRAQADPDKYQSWADFTMSCNEDSGFDEYIPMEERDKNEA